MVGCSMGLLCFKDLISDLLNFVKQLIKMELHNLDGIEHFS